MKTIEIYDYDTNKLKFTIQTRKTKNIQDDIIKFLKTIEIYDNDTNNLKFNIKTRKTKNIQDIIIKILKYKKYSLILQGKVIHNIETNLYWLAYKKATKERIKLWYREKENVKEK